MIPDEPRWSFILLRTLRTPSCYSLSGRHGDMDLPYLVNKKEADFGVTLENNEQTDLTRLCCGRGFVVGANKALVINHRVVAGIN